MEDKMEKHDHNNTDKSFTTYFYKGRICYIAKDVGDRLGYSHNGGKLVNQISVNGLWGSQFQHGIDYIKLVGDELAHFKSFAQEHTDSVGSRAKHLILLYRSGFNKVFKLSGKPMAKLVEGKPINIPSPPPKEIDEELPQELSLKGRLIKYIAQKIDDKHTDLQNYLTTLI